MNDFVVIGKDGREISWTRATPPSEEERRLFGLSIKPKAQPKPSSPLTPKGNSDVAKPSPKQPAGKQTSVPGKFMDVIRGRNAGVITPDLPFPSAPVGPTSKLERETFQKASGKSVTQAKMRTPGTLEEAMAAWDRANIGRETRGFDVPEKLRAARERYRLNMAQRMFNEEQRIKSESEMPLPQALKEVGQEALGSLASTGSRLAGAVRETAMDVAPLMIPGVPAYTEEERQEVRDIAKEQKGLEDAIGLAALTAGIPGGIVPQVAAGVGIGMASDSTKPLAAGALDAQETAGGGLGGIALFNAGSRLLGSKLGPLFAFLPVSARVGGNIVGQLGAAFLGAFGGQKASEAMQKANPAYGEWKGWLREEMAKNPELANVGQVVGSLAPWKASPQKLAQLGRSLKQASASGSVKDYFASRPEELSNLIDVGLGGLIETGVEGVRQIGEGQFDPMSLALATVSGFLYSEPGKLASKMGVTPTDISAIQRSLDQDFISGGPRPFRMEGEERPEPLPIQPVQSDIAQLGTKTALQPMGQFTPREADAYDPGETPNLRGGLREEPTKIFKEPEAVESVSIGSLDKGNIVTWGGDKSYEIVDYNGKNQVLVRDVDGQEQWVSVRTPVRLVATSWRDATESAIRDVAQRSSDSPTTETPIAQPVASPEPRLEPTPTQDTPIATEGVQDKGADDDAASDAMAEFVDTYRGKGSSRSSQKAHDDARERWEAAGRPVEPWRLTHQQAKIWGEMTSSLGQSGRKQSKIHGAFHEAQVKLALSEGRRVPDRVVDDFVSRAGNMPDSGIAWIRENISLLHPDLAKKYRVQEEVAGAKGEPETSVEGDVGSTPAASTTFKRPSKMPTKPDAVLKEALRLHAWAEDSGSPYADDLADAISELESKIADEPRRSDYDNQDDFNEAKKEWSDEVSDLRGDVLSAYDSVASGKAPNVASNVGAPDVLDSATKQVAIDLIGKIGDGYTSDKSDGSVAFLNQSSKAIDQLETIIKSTSDIDVAQAALDRVGMFNRGTILSELKGVFDGRVSSGELKPTTVASPEPRLEPTPTQDTPIATEGVQEQTETLPVREEVQGGEAVGAPILRGDDARSATWRFSISIGETSKQYTLWMKHPGSHYPVYLVNLGKDPDRARDAAEKYIIRIQGERSGSIGFYAKDGNRIDPKEGDTFGLMDGVLSSGELNESAKGTPFGSQRIDFGKYGNTIVDDLPDVDIDYAMWLVRNASYGRMKDVADHLVKLPVIRDRLSDLTVASESAIQSHSELYSRIGISTESSGGKVVLSGKTYDIKDRIKKFGGRYVRDSKGVWEMDPSEFDQLSRELQGLDRTDGSAGSLSEGAVEIRNAVLSAPDQSSINPSDYISNETVGLLEGGRKFGMPQSVIDEQVEDAALIVRAFTDGKPLFMLASQPGSGKTFVLGAAIRELQQRGVKSIVYVTKSSDLIAQVKSDLASYGIVDGVTFISYSDIRTAKVQSSDVLIFDEAHSVKNVEGAAQAKRADQWIDNAKTTVFATATPFESIVQMQYLDAAGVFDQFGGFEKVALAYGAKWFPIRDKYGNEVGRRWTYKRNKNTASDLATIREFFRRNGMLTSRATRLPAGMVDSRMVKVQSSPDSVTRFNEFTAAAARGGGISDDGTAEPLSSTAQMWVVNFQKRLLEASKVQDGINLAKDAMSRGRYPIIFVETKAERKINIPELVEAEAEYWRAKLMAQEMGDSPPTRDQYGLPPIGIVEILHDYSTKTGEDVIVIPSAEDVIMDALGDQVAIYTGSVTPAKAQKNLADWRSGRKKVLVATMAKGGTGLSLHDKAGNHPTTQININLPWTATQVTQVTQRSARYGLASKAEVVWLFTDNIPFDRSLASRVGGRMEDMGAAVYGERIEASHRLQDWSMEDVPFSEQNNPNLNDEYGVPIVDTPSGVQEEVAGAKSHSKRTIRVYHHTDDPDVVLSRPGAYFTTSKVGYPRRPGRRHHLEFDIDESSLNLANKRQATELGMFRGDPDAFIQNLKDAGYDGAKYSDYGETTYVLVDPSIARPSNQADVLNTGAKGEPEASAEGDAGSTPAASTIEPPVEVASGVPLNRLGAKPIERGPTPDGGNVQIDDPKYGNRDWNVVHDLAQPVSVIDVNGNTISVGAFERVGGALGKEFSQHTQNAKHNFMMKKGEWESRIATIKQLIERASGIDRIPSFLWRKKKDVLRRAESDFIELVERPFDDPERMKVAASDTELGQALRMHDELTEQWRQYIIETRRSLGIEMADDWGITDKGYFRHAFLDRVKVIVDGEIVYAANYADAQRIVIQALEKNPNANVMIRARIPNFGKDEAVELSRKGFWRLVGRLSQSVQIDKADILDDIKGVVRPKHTPIKFYGPLLERKGAKGYSLEYGKIMDMTAVQLARSMELSKWARNVQPIIDRFRKNEGTPEQLDPYHKPLLANAMDAYKHALWGTPTESEKKFGQLVRRVFPNAESPEFALREIADKITSLQSYLSLRYNIRSSAANLFQVSRTLFPFTSAKEMARLTAKIIQDKDFREIIKHSGVVRDMSKLDEASLRTWKKAAKWTPFGAASDFNRALGFAFGYEQAIKNGMDADSAIRNGLTWAEKVEFDNTVWNVQPVMRAPMARILFQFKSFAVKDFENFLSVIGKMPGDEKIPFAKARRITKWLAGLGLGAGVRVGDVVAKLFGIQLAVSVYQAAKEAFIENGMDEETADKTAAGIYLGVPAGLGADMSSSLGLPWLEEWYGRTPWEKLGGFAGGPTLGKAVKVYSDIQSGNLDKIPKRVTPYAKAWEAVDSWVSGNPIQIKVGNEEYIDPPLSMAESVMYALGFTPTRQTLFYELKDAGVGKRDLPSELETAMRKAGYADPNRSMSSVPESVPKEKRTEYKNRVWEGFLKAAKTSMTEDEFRDLRRDVGKRVRQEMGLDKDDEKKSSSRFGNVESRFGNVESRFGNVESRFGNVESRFGNVESRFN